MSNHNRAVSSQTAAAVELWQALEYLGPQKPPKVSARDGVWAIRSTSSDAKLPWNDPEKQELLKTKFKKWRFHVFSGIADGVALVDEARTALGARPTPEQQEQMPPTPAACLMIETDASGMATGQIFVSTVPWAMSKIIQCTGSVSPIDFRGFFGNGNFDEELRGKIRDLLIARQLLPAESADGSATGNTAPMPAPASATSAGMAPPLVSRSTITQLERVNATHGQATAPLRSVTVADIDIVTTLVFEMCGWRPVKELPWRIKALKASEKEEGAKKVLDDPLNSFFTDDLEQLADVLARGDYGHGLRAYLQDEQPTGRIDLETNRTAVIEAVQPFRHPASCWPAKYPLVTAQQFAVNTLFNELAQDGIFSVNGPPGTGKTTMLKDIIASIVTDRADVLVTLDAPLSAFGAKLDIDNYKYGEGYALDERLRGFGMVVASANNGAVENITKDLPDLKSIASEFDLDYFSAVADSLGAGPNAKKCGPQRQCWGLVSAVLGNKTNRSEFASRFWFADMNNKPSNGDHDAPPALDPRRFRSLPSLIAQNDHGALSWDEARGRYRKARNEVARLVNVATAGAASMADLQRAKDHARSVQCQTLAERLLDLNRAVAAAPAPESADADLVAAQQRLSAVESACTARDEALNVEERLKREESGMPAGGLAAAKAAHEHAKDRLKNTDTLRQAHMAARPGLIAELFSLPSSKRWNAMEEQLNARWSAADEEEKASKILHDRASQAEGAIAALRQDAQRAEQKLMQAWSVLARIGISGEESLDELEIRVHEEVTQAKQCKASVQALHASVAAVQADLHAQERLAADIARQIGDFTDRIDALGLSEKALASWDMKQLDRTDFHRATPYQMPALFHARRELFVAAMELHKAFIVSSWKKLRPTLQIFINLLIGTINPAQVKQGVSQLWDVFFLVVPVVSTAFASFSRLFAGVEREQLAWLMIDEAGQANPQHAAGAIWRAQRSIVVGDPLQLKPVAPVPEEIVAALLERYRIDKRWAPPSASVQVLADRSNRYGTYHGELDQPDRIWLGSPLVVHRRCLNPMFSIANAIAYNNMMVYGTADDEAPNDAKSVWYHVAATGNGAVDGHWIEAQGNVTIALVRNILGPMHKGNIRDKVFVITPFKTVAEKIEALLHQEFESASDGMSGTVHTFQGKEADYVIFLLGGNPATPGVISTFAGAEPNLVNVAVTRAKRRLFVVGDLSYWTGADDVRQIYAELARQLPKASAHPALGLLLPAPAVQY